MSRFPSGTYILGDKNARFSQDGLRNSKWERGGFTGQRRAGSELLMLSKFQVKISSSGTLINPLVSLS